MPAAPRDISEEDFREILAHLDKDSDGVVTKDEFRMAYLLIRPEMEAAEFEGLWASMDADGNGELDLKELAAYYGFDMGGFGAHGMSDEQIWEMLKLQDALVEARRADEVQKQPAEAPAAPAPARRTSRGLDGVRRPVTILSESERKAAGVTAYKMPASVGREGLDAHVRLLVASELGDARAIDELISQNLSVRIEDEKEAAQALALPQSLLAESSLARSRTTCTLTHTPPAAPHSQGEMPLHKLARGGKEKLLRAVLVQSDSKLVDLNWQDKQGKTPLMLAAEFNHPDLVKLLIEYGSDAFVENVAMTRCLHPSAAGARGWWPSRGEMLPKLCPPQAAGGTALHCAVAHKAEDAITVMRHHHLFCPPPMQRHLTLHGPAADPRPQTLLECVRASERKRLIDHTDKCGRSVLHLAAFSENENMTQTLIEHGASSASDAYGNKPSVLAAKTGRRNSKDLLEALEKKIAA
uniref:EF-hand domain-containing protein n=2 Tax=Emiliania huxleyi TaxID=2903 RepID=A0A7S3SEQ1_EMIHU